MLLEEAAGIPSPEEIETIRDRELAAERARANPGFSTDEPPRLQAMSIDLFPSDFQPFNPQAVRVSDTNISAMTFIDRGGNRWPIRQLVYDNAALSVNGTECATDGQSANGDVGAVGSSILNIRACDFWVRTNMTVVLDGVTMPIIYEVRAGQGPAPQVPETTDILRRQPGTSEDFLSPIDISVVTRVDGFAPTRAAVKANGEPDFDWIQPIARRVSIEPLDSTSPRNPTPVFLAKGVITDASFVDSSNRSWPIEDVVFDPRVVSINGSECSEAAQSNQPNDEDANVIYISLCADTRSTVAVKMRGRSAALSLLVVPITERDRERRPDSTLTITIPGTSPLQAERSSADLLAAADPEVRAGGGFTPDRYLDNFITGVPPQSARSVRIAGDPETQAWLYNGSLYVRGPVQVVNPAHDARAFSPENATYVWRFDRPTRRILVVDGSGQERILSADF